MAIWRLSRLRASNETGTPPAVTDGDIVARMPVGVCDGWAGGLWWKRWASDGHPTHRKM